jgi:hypothetical protein
VLADPRRKRGAASARVVVSYRTATAALSAAAGGPSPLWSNGSRLPSGLSLPLYASRARGLGSSSAALSSSEARFSIARIRIPALSTRTSELSRIVGEHAADAIEVLSATVPLTARDHEWVCDHCVSSLHEIEKATLRIVALRQTSNVRSAANVLGMSHVALSRWFRRRRRR